MSMMDIKQRLKLEKKKKQETAQAIFIVYQLTQFLTHGRPRRLHAYVFASRLFIQLFLQLALDVRGFFVDKKCCAVVDLVQAAFTWALT